MNSGFHLKKTVFLGYGILIIKIRRSWGRLIFIMGIPYTGDTVSWYWDDPRTCRKEIFDKHNINLFHLPLSYRHFCTKVSDAIYRVWMAYTSVAPPIEFAMNLVLPCVFLGICESELWPKFVISQFQFEFKLEFEFEFKFKLCSKKRQKWHLSIRQCTTGTVFIANH